MINWILSWFRPKPKLSFEYFDPAKLSPEARALVSKPPNVCANCFLAAVTDDRYVRPCRSSTGLCTNKELGLAARRSGYDFHPRAEGRA